MKMKNISNVFKIIVGLFILYQYWHTSASGHIMNSDECKGLLFIALCSFAILCPIDASIFISNLNKLRADAKSNSENRTKSESEDKNNGNVS